MARWRFKLNQVFSLIPFCSQNCPPTTSGPISFHVLFCWTTDANIQSANQVSLNTFAFNSFILLYLSPRFNQSPNFVNLTEIFQIPILLILSITPITSTAKWNEPLLYSCLNFSNNFLGDFVALLFILYSEDRYPPNMNLIFSFHWPEPFSEFHCLWDLNSLA